MACVAFTYPCNGQMTAFVTITCILISLKFRRVYLSSFLAMAIGHFWANLLITSHPNFKLNIFIKFFGTYQFNLQMSRLIFNMH